MPKHIIAVIESNHFYTDVYFSTNANNTEIFPHHLDIIFSCAHATFDSLSLNCDELIVFLLLLLSLSFYLDWSFVVYVRCSLLLLLSRLRLHLNEQ